MFNSAVRLTRKSFLFSLLVAFTDREPVRNASASSCIKSIDYVMYPFSAGAPPSGLLSYSAIVLDGPLKLYRVKQISLLIGMRVP